MTTSAIDGLWTEPESAANVDTPPIYPYNNVNQTESGHSMEMDDTPGRERIRIQHRGANTANGMMPGSFIEMHPNGDVVHKIYGESYEIIAGRKNIQIKGTCNITIEGDCNMHVLGNKTEVIDGNYTLQVAGSMTARSAGTPGMTLISDTTMRLQSDATETGSMVISAGDHVFIASDVQVAGSISADTISAESRINAGTGLYAGTQGVYSTGSITSLDSVQAPSGTFGTMNAVLMTDVVNSGNYNTHIHDSPKGPTSTPLPKFQSGA
jgi:hypothetical protein